MRGDPMGALVVGVVLLGLVVWARGRCRGAKATPGVTPPSRSTGAPKPFAGFLPTPDGPLGEQATASPPSASAPPAPPPRLLGTPGRRRHSDRRGHGCPQDTCSSHGWVGGGHLRAHGHPQGRRWRPRVCLGGKRPGLETPGTRLHGPPGEPEKLGGAIAARADGRGLRAVARVFETDPHTILLWGVEAAAHLEACSRHFGHALAGEQGQRDELCALLRAGKDGEGSEGQALQRGSRAPPGL